MISNQLATWLLLIGLVSIISASVGAWWLSFHIEEPDDDLKRLYELDLRRARRDAALSRTNPWRAQ